MEMGGYNSKNIIKLLKMEDNWQKKTDTKIWHIKRVNPKLTKVQIFENIIKTKTKDKDCEITHSKRQRK